MTADQIETCCHLAGFGFGSLFWWIVFYTFFGGGGK